MGMRRVTVGIVALLCSAGCAQAPAASTDAEKPEISAAQASLVLDDAPTDIPNARYIDFNSKAALLGYAISPSNLAAPGSKLSLKLYWRSVSKLDEGYTLFTQLVTPAGKRFDVDASGVLRQGGALAPSNWQPGKVYVDEVELSVPEEIDAASFSIVVGFKTAPIAPEEPDAAEGASKDEKAEPKKDEKPAEASFSPIYLTVLSGVADSKFGGVVATLATGVTPGAKRARAAKDEKRGGVKRHLPPGKLPIRSAQPGSAPKPAQ